MYLTSERNPRSWPRALKLETILHLSRDQLIHPHGHALREAHARVEDGWAWARAVLVDGHDGDRATSGSALSPPRGVIRAPFAGLI